MLAIDLSMVVRQAFESTGQRMVNNIASTGQEMASKIASTGQKMVGNIEVSY